MTASNLAPMEGPGGGSDKVLVYVNGLPQGTATMATVTTDSDWISSYSTLSVKNGPNPFRFQVTSNKEGARTGHFALTLFDGSAQMQITIIQAGSSFVPAGPVMLTSSMVGPEAIDVDPQGNLYILEVSGAYLYEWNAATQQVSTIKTYPANTFVDVALDAAGDVFTLENTQDQRFGSVVEQILPASQQILSSESNQYLFPSGLCVDAPGQNLSVVTVDISNKCVVDQFQTVYQVNTHDANDNLGVFASAPSNNGQIPVGTILFNSGTTSDLCGDTIPGVSGSVYGLSKDGSDYIYFLDQNGSRLNRFDPGGTQFISCTTPTTIVNGLTVPGTTQTSYLFSTQANLPLPAFYTAADATGNIYLTTMLFSQVQELPRAYVSPAPLSEPVGGGTDTIQYLPVTQEMTGAFAPVSSDTSWLNVVSTANGVVTFSFSANSGPARSATITVLGVPIQVTQAESQVPAYISIISGNNQTASVNGLSYAVNLLVKVTNQFGHAVANVPVQFTSPNQESTVLTSQRGYAGITGWGAHNTGSNNVTASIAGTNLSQTFNLYGTLPGIAVFSGSGQSYPVSSQFNPLYAVIYGPNGSGVGGIQVTFTAPASGASGSFGSAGGPTSWVATTSSGGIAVAPFFSNSIVGSYQVTASFNATFSATTTCAFSETNVPVYIPGPLGGTVTKTVADQTTYVNNPFASPLSVTVRDSNGNPWAGSSVLFSLGGVTPGPISFPGGADTATVLTGNDGTAVSPQITATSAVGTFPVYAFVTFPDGDSQTVTWNLITQPLNIYSGGFQNGPTTRTLPQPIIVQASPAANTGTMVFTVVPGATGAGGSFGGQSSATVNLDSQGYGISPPLTVNATPGTFNVTAYDGVATISATVQTTQCLNPNNGSVVVADTVDYNPQNPSSVDTASLRYALANVCAGSTIDLTQVTGTITLGSRLRIDDSLTINGPGASALAIDGGATTRLFFIGGGTVSINNLTLQHGLAQGFNSSGGGASAGMGGAIFMESGSVTVSGVIFMGNTAEGGSTDGGFKEGGAGFASNGQSFSPTLGTDGQGGSAGDLFGLGGLTDGASGDFGGGGAATAALGGTAGSGGFGAGGGYETSADGTHIQTSGNGGFGGGGGAGFLSIVIPGGGGFGGGNGVPANTTNYPAGGGGAGFGGAVFEYGGTLTLSGDQFLNNSAIGGGAFGASAPLYNGQGKGGALFIYNGAIAIDNGVTFSGDAAASAGLPGVGHSPAPYSNGATCPGQDTVDVCGMFDNGASLTVNVPSNASFTLDSATYTGPQTFTVPEGQYTLSAANTQSTGVGSQIAFGSWSDGGTASHTITVGPAGLSVTGTFITQYLLTISASGSGSTIPASSGYYNAGTTVNLNAQPSNGNTFESWTGPVAAPNSMATTVTMNAPQNVAASFATNSVVNVNVPPGVSFTLNNANYTGPQILMLAPGGYSLSTTNSQSIGPNGEQQAMFNSWSDGGAISHTISVGSVPLTITGSFTTQYQLTVNAGIGGTVSQSTGQFFSSGTVVNLTATPNPGYVFQSWTGSVASAYSATTTVTVSRASTITANFWPAPAACVAAPANITAWWSGNGSASDLSGFYNGTLGGDVSFAAGLAGQAFSFDGTQSPYVTIPVGAFPTQPGTGAFSFETWFQTAGGNGGVILGQQSAAPYSAVPGAWSPAVYVGTDGNLYVEMFDNGSANPVVGPVPVNDNHWHHVAVTYDGNNEAAYLDGANIGILPSYVQVPNGSPLSYQLGTGYTNNWPATNNGWYTFTGLIDEPTTYSRALTAAEVQSIAQAGSYGKCNPVASISPTALAFTSTAEGQTATQAAVVSNTGNAPLSISAVTLNGTSFSVLNGNTGDCATGTPVAPGATCNVRVQFAPQSTGSLTGQVTVTDNSLYLGGVQTVTLSGSAQPGTPTAGTVSPASGTGSSQTFTATYTDPNGLSNLTSVRLLLNTGVIGANACYAEYYPASNRLDLVNNANNGLVGPLTPGSSSSVSNSQCTLNGSGSSVSTSGNTITVSFDLTFLPAFDGAKNIYLAAYGASANSGFVLQGTYTVNLGSPSVGTVSPAAASGGSQTFSATYTDPNGLSDLASTRILFNTSVNGMNACYVRYVPASNALYLENNTNNGLLGPVTPGSSSSVSNSQCTLNGTGSTVTTSGTTATVNYNITFLAGFLGAKNIYLATYGETANSGFVLQGTYTVNLGAPTVGTVTPASGTGLSQTFTATYTDPNGLGDLASTRILFNTSVDGVAACYVSYHPGNSTFYLENDSNNGTAGTIPLGSTANVTNSQCVLNGSGSTVTTTGTSITVSYNISFLSAFKGAKKVYLATYGSTANSGFIQQGSYNVSAGNPSVGTLSPNSGTGASQTFSASYSDPNGLSDLVTARLLFNTSVNGVGACYAYYNLTNGNLYLANDTNNGLLGPVVPGSANSVSNSQCMLNGAGTTVSTSGNTVTVNWDITFLGSFIGTPEKAYAAAYSAAANSGFVLEGTWTP